ncbi:MAG: hypothetical protein AAB916_02375 [Patescibacteria group bacterium]
MKRFAFVVLMGVALSWSWVEVTLAGGFPLDEEAVVYRHPNGAVVYIMGMSEWLASIQRGLEHRGFRQNGTAPAGHEPQEARYCKLPLKYRLSGKNRRQEVQNVHCYGSKLGGVGAFHYESPYFLEWVFESIEGMAAE